jgi:hypothetical protein
MRTITVELDDDHYHRYEYISNDLGKTVEEHAKQQLENIADAFYETVKNWVENKELK